MLTYSKELSLDFQSFSYSNEDWSQCLSWSVQSVHPSLTSDGLPSWLKWVILFLGVSRTERDQRDNHMALVALSPLPLLVQPAAALIRVSKSTAEAYLGELSVRLSGLTQPHGFQSTLRRVTARVTYNFQFQIPEYLSIQILYIPDLLTLLITGNRFIFHSSTFQETEVNLLPGCR